MVFGLNGSICWKSAEGCVKGCSSGSTEDWAFLGDGFDDVLGGGLGSSSGGTTGSDTSASTTTIFFLRGALSLEPAGRPRLFELAASFSGAFSGAFSATIYGFSGSFIMFSRTSCDSSAIYKVPSSNIKVN